jgi:anaerobic selenocysteine-containing dehydrogenase
VYRSYGHRRLQYARAACRAPGAGEGPRSNVDAFAAVARALGLPAETHAVSEEGLCEELLQASAGRLGAEALARVLTGEAVELEPVPGRATPSGKVELQSAAAAAHGQPECATYVPDDACGTAGAYWLIPAPSVHTHNSTYSHSPRHRARVGAARVFMHPDDAADEGLAEGGGVTLSNRRGAVTLELGLTTDLPRGCLRVDGLPRADQVPEGIGINVLVSPALSDLGWSNTLYSTRVDVRAASGAVAL